MHEAVDKVESVFLLLPYSRPNIVTGGRSEKALYRHYHSGIMAQIVDNIPLICLTRYPMA